MHEIRAHRAGELLRRNYAPVAHEPLCGVKDTGLIRQRSMRERLDRHFHLHRIHRVRAKTQFYLRAGYACDLRITRRRLSAHDDLAARLRLKLRHRLRSQLSDICDIRRLFRGRRSGRSFL